MNRNPLNDYEENTFIKGFYLYEYPFDRDFEYWCNPFSPAIEYEEPCRFWAFYNRNSGRTDILKKINIWDRIDYAVTLNNSKNNILYTIRSIDVDEASYIKNLGIGATVVLLTYSGYEKKPYKYYICFQPEIDKAVLSTKPKIHQNIGDALEGLWHGSNGLDRDILSKPDELLKHLNIIVAK